MDGRWRAPGTAGAIRRDRCQGQDPLIGRAIGHAQFDGSVRRTGADPNKQQRHFKGLEGIRGADPPPFGRHRTDGS